MPEQFELQPTLIGKLILARPLHADDFDPLFAVARDPLIWEQHPNSDRFQEPVFREFFATAIASRGALLVQNMQTNAVIGSSRFANLNVPANRVEIGWTFLARSHWGGAYNRELKQLMLDHAFRFVKHVEFVIGPQNLRSRRAVEKIGAVLIETRVDQAGQERVVYQLSRPESFDSHDS